MISYIIYETFIPYFAEVYLNFILFYLENFNAYDSVTSLIELRSSLFPTNMKTKLLESQLSYIFVIH